MPTTTTTTTTTTQSGVTTTTTTTTTTTLLAPTRPAAPSRGFPLAPDEVTASFLSEALGAEVASFECDVPDSMGYLADAFRVHGIVYAAGAAAGPAELFIKCTKSSAPDAAELAAATAIYSKEVYFYEHLRGQVAGSICVPSLYALRRDENDAECRNFCIVMEALRSDEWMTFHQFESPMSAADLESYLRFIAGLHACTWDIPLNEAQTGLGVYAAHFHFLCKDFVGHPATWPKFLEEWEDVYGTSLLSGFEEQEGVVESVVGITEMMVGLQGEALDAAMQAQLRTRPRCLTHGDARGANVFRRRRAEGVNDSELWALVDWQMWAAGPCVNDFPQVFLNSFSPESGVTKRLDSYLELYHAALCAQQPAAERYSLAELQADFRLALVDMWFQVRAPLDSARCFAVSLTRKRCGSGPHHCAVHRVHHVLLSGVPRPGQGGHEGVLAQDDGAQHGDAALQRRAAGAAAAGCGN